MLNERSNFSCNQLPLIRLYRSNDYFISGYFRRGNNYLGYVVTMARDSSLRRGETPGAQQNGEEADELSATRLPDNRPIGSSVSVTLWDEIPPAPSHTTRPLADESPEA
ncbi:hypothetical protein [Caballeronia glebae]|nr:hypothetical protein [Caballeronia glebae]